MVKSTCLTIQEVGEEVKMADQEAAISPLMLLG